MKASVEISGMRELEAALAELGNPTQRRTVARRAARKALEPMAEIARALVPVRTGRLKDSIRVASQAIGAGADRQAFAQVMQSGGTRDAALAAMRNVRRAGVSLVEMHMGPSGANRKGGFLPYAHFIEFGTQHAPPQSFVRAAWDQDSQAALDRIKAELWADIERTARRNAARAARAARIAAGEV